MKLFFREEGKENKSTIVIVHGLYGSSDNWLTVGKKLGQNFHVYMVDQRNHGRSPNADSHTYEDMTEDLASFFEEHHIEKATIVGHSMGGKTAMAFAADYPEKVNKLIVADISPKNYFELEEKSQYYLHQYILESLKEVRNQQFESREEIADFLKLKLDVDNLVLFLLKNVYRNKETKKFDCRINVDVLFDYLDEIISGVNYRWFEDRMPIFNYPTLFIKGADSEYITDTDIIKIKEIYPEVQISTIPNAGHWLHAEQPKLFMEALERFI
ncbi:alpha/beta fold hydrolase [Sunxiuqinia sp. A32]|uniref:alpha/beta fold hydrolase n=1 Tax=Sunxiuqinia sp. A32 TaxID=3461496 RepID=UPI0040460052